MNTVEAIKSVPTARFTSDEMRGMFTANAQEMTADSPTSFTKTNDQMLKAQSGMYANTTSYTGIAQDQKAKTEEDKKRRMTNARGISQTAKQINLDGVTFDNGDFSVDKDGDMNINGAKATLEQKIKIENNSGVCSIDPAHRTRDEREMGEYAQGKTDIKPDSVRALEKEYGLPENASTEQINAIIQNKLPSHISQGIIHGHDEGGLPKLGLINPEDLNRLPQSSVSNKIGESGITKQSFNTAAPGEVTPPKPTPEAPAPVAPSQVPTCSPSGAMGG